MTKEEAPEVIYLQVDTADGVEVTWCKDRINETDVKYVKAISDR